MKGLRENETVEFKKSIAQLDKGILGLTAMLNRSNRGTVYFGIDDAGDAVGMEIGESTFEKIRNAVRNYVEPRIVLDFETVVAENGKECLAVHSSGFDVPYSYDGRYYIRHGSSNEHASPEMIAKMVLSRNFDSMRELESYSDKLTFTTLNDMLIVRGFHPRTDRNYLNSIGLLNKDGKFNLNANLVSDDNDIIIQVVEFEGIDRTSFSKRTDRGNQCIFMAMKDVLEYVRSRNETRIKVSSGIREETDLFDFECFREAWVNACIHNAWRMMIPPSVSLFDDRIEIQSVGGIPYALPMEDFFEGRSMPVNESLFRLSVMLGFSEHTGRGIPTIVDKYGRQSIRISENTVTVVIPYAFEPSYISAREGSKLKEIELDDKERSVLDYLKLHRDAKISDVASFHSLSPSAVKRIISSLKTKGLLRNDGTNRNNVWVVA